MKIHIQCLFLLAFSLAQAQQKNQESKSDTIRIEPVEFWGQARQVPDKLESITGLPLPPKDQLQNLSIISHRLIEKQETLTLTDVLKNVPGVYPYASYGGTRESIGSRGFRGIPILLNGVRVHSDFRGQGFLMEPEGIDNIQVLKGAAAITQGFGADIGSPAGVINLVTKTPRFHNTGSASLRAGSWGFAKASFDVDRLVDDAKSAAFRVNGVYQRSDGFRPYTEGTRYYFNPSFTWKLSERTELNLETSYLDDARTPDAGTVNASLTEEKYVDLPRSQSLGLKDVKSYSKNLNSSVRVKYHMTDHLRLHVAYHDSWLRMEGDIIKLSQFIDKQNQVFTKPYNIVNRSIEPLDRSDRNQVFRADLVANDLQTGDFKHLVQLGYDYRLTRVDADHFKTQIVDREVDIFSDHINHAIPIPERELKSSSKDHNQSMGVMAQYVLEYHQLARLFVSGRYSRYDNERETYNHKDIIEKKNSMAKGATVDPLVGLMIMPKSGLNFYASYATVTDPEGRTKTDKDGNFLGSSNIDQYETGVKTECLDGKLRLKLSLYRIQNRNMIIQAVEENEHGALEEKDYYFKGGNEVHDGIEFEVTSRILPGLELMGGYSYVDARIYGSTAFVERSSPNNTPKHTMNLSSQYACSGILEGFRLGADVFYIGERPYNDWIKSTSDFHGLIPGLKPYNNRAYTTVNARIGYGNKKYDVKFLVNNLFDALGYSAYRNVYVNRIDPRNFAVKLSCKF